MPRAVGLYNVIFVVYGADVGAGDGTAVGGVDKADRVFDYKLYVFVIKGGIGFVARLEVEDLSVSALVKAARTEDLATLVPADKDNLIGIGDAEGLGIGFYLGKLEISADALSDGVGGVDCPDTF